MVGSINKVILVGNLGADPKVANTASGTKVVNLNIATSDSWKDKLSGERKERTEWHRVVIFNPQLADVAEKYLRKGSKVYLEGQLQTRKWEDNNGQERYTTEIVLQNFSGNMVLLDGRGDGVPAGGTMAHSWVQMFPTEYDAFKTYCELYPDNATLLVDTYNTLKSGVPNAIRAFKEILLPRGITNFAIRLDSGDISYLSKKARKMLDEAGLPNCKITASNSLDEYLIRDLMMQGAQVDTFGVGERLITSKSNPVFGGVYKLAAIEDDEGNIIPKIKVSENTAKITNPHFKRLYRLYDRESGKAIADELTLRDEVIDPTKPHVIFDPNATWKTKELTDFTVRELQVPIFQNGELVYELPELNDIKAYCRQQIHTLWDEVKRFENPHTYYVDLSQKLWDVKRGLLEAAKC